MCHKTLTHNLISFQAFDSRQGMRKIILATNVAESSITIPDVTYVVDFCLTKKLNANKETNYVSLQLEWAGVTSCWVFYPL